MYKSGQKIISMQQDAQAGHLNKLLKIGWRVFKI